MDTNMLFWFFVGWAIGIVIVCLLIFLANYVSYLLWLRDFNRKHPEPVYRPRR